MRLQVYLARSGYGSRRKCEDLIRQGKVRVDGFVAKLGTKVSDEPNVTVDGKLVLKTDKKIYVMLNKPKGYLTSREDTRGRKTVFDLLTNMDEAVKKTLFNVGRLDFDTSGLLLFTNDGAFAQELAHPKHDVDKTYVAKVRGIINRAAIARLRKGLKVFIKFGHKLSKYRTRPAQVKLKNKGQTYSIVEITISEGKKRQVRQMLKSVGFPVMSLKRIRIANLDLGRLEEGRWRYITKFDMSQLGFKNNIN